MTVQVQDGSMILDGRAIHGKSFAEYLSWKDVVAIGIRRGWKPPAPTAVAAVEPLTVWIQQGWLVVTCPDCAERKDNELQAFWLEGPHVMFCTLCGNVSVGGVPRPAVLPPEYDEIVALLAIRPMHQRTWHVGQTLTDLRAENVQLGYEVIAPALPEGGGP